MNWVAVSWMIEVASTAQTKMGMRKRLMPGARIFRVVTMRLSEPRIEEKPKNEHADHEEIAPRSAP